MIEIAHLYILNTCGHNCPLCCNRLYNIDKIPCITNEILLQVHTVCLTGGDPFYLGDLPLGNLVTNMRKQFPNIKNVYIYTSGTYLRYFLADIFKSGICKVYLPIEGVTISPKNEEDWKNLQYMLSNYYSFFDSLVSNRLLVFQDQVELYHRYIDLSILTPLNIQVIGRNWQKEFNTPDNERFYRLPMLLD